MLTRCFRATAWGAAMLALAGWSLVGCSSGQRATSNPWVEGLDAVPQHLPEGFSEPLSEDVPADAFRSFAVVAESDGDDAPAGAHLIVTAQPEASRATLEGLGLETTDLAGREVWARTESDGSFEAVAHDADGCPELRIFGRDGADLADVEPIVAEGSCEALGTPWVYTPTVPPLPGYRVVAAPADPRHSVITTAMGHTSGGPPHRPSRVDVVAMQVDDPAAWERWFPGPVLDQEEMGGRAVTRRDPTPLLTDDERTGNEDPSWLWTWVEGDDTFVAVTVTNMAEAPARDILAGVEWVPAAGRLNPVGASVGGDSSV